MSHSCWRKTGSTVGAAGGTGTSAGTAADEEDVDEEAVAPVDVPAAEAVALFGERALSSANLASITWEKGEERRGKKLKGRGGVEWSGVECVMGEWCDGWMVQGVEE